MKTKSNVSTIHHKNGNGGPTTQRGKAISSQNARKHGLLSRELKVTEEDKPLLQELERALNEELAPGSTLLNILANDILVCYWHLKMCIRRKNEYLEGLQAEHRDADSPPRASSPAELRGDWNLRKRLQLLQAVREDVQPTGVIRDGWKNELIAAFGQSFYETLMQWHPTQGMYLLMIESEIKKDEIYHPGERPPESEITTAAEKQAQLEAPLRRAAVMKFIEMQEQSLVSQASLQAASQSQHSDPLELYQRYETTARRNLHRAIREYMRVRRDLLFLGDDRC